MFLFDLFRSFLPLHNPWGFGAADFLALSLALAVLAFAFLWRPWLAARAASLASRPLHAAAFLAALPLVLRLALLRFHPVPTPEVSDDFSYLLLADTLRHFRLANPPLPLPQFFETFFTLQSPSYSSIFPLGQGLLLALGWTLLGHPWAGVALSVSALCALAFWMLRAWTTPGWAFAGALLAVVQFGPLSQWMNSYWGGALAACSGCLVFGAIPRLRSSPRLRDALLLGAGLALHLLTRPFESLALFFSASLLLLIPFSKPLFRHAAPALVPLLAAAALMLFHNHAVTRSWLTTPYQLSQSQYGVPASFTFQPNPTPSRPLTPQQQLDYLTQSDLHGAADDTPARFFSRLASRFRFVRFFLPAPLYLALPFFLLTLRRRESLAALLSLAAFFLVSNVYPYFYPHYIAASSCLFLYLAVASLHRLSQIRFRSLPSGASAARLLLFLVAFTFLFWFSLHLTNPAFSAEAIALEPWDAVNSPDPLGRAAILHRLPAPPTQSLVFVRYGGSHRFHEWVHNLAVLDSAPIVWARDLGPSQNAALLSLFPHRTPWLLEPDAHPAILIPYPVAP